MSSTIEYVEFDYPPFFSVKTVSDRLIELVEKREAQGTPMSLQFYTDIDMQRCFSCNKRMDNKHQDFGLCPVCRADKGLQPVGTS